MSNFRLLGTAAAALAVAGAACGQAIPPRSDAVEAKRIHALAVAQRLGVSARSQFDPRIATSAPGQKGCTFNIGDIRAAQESDGLGRPLQRGGLGRTEYITLVEATPICVQR